MSTVQTWVGRFVWHDQVSSDPAQAQEFYTQLFGWDTEAFDGEMEYTMISSEGKTHGGFGKAMEGAPPPHWLGHIRVEDVDESILKAESAGGKLAAGPFDMSDAGRMAIISDPQGAYISIYQPEGEGAGPEGVFVWDELGTTDVDGAQRFYEEVFGWTTRDMGDEFGGYRIFRRGETDVGGMMRLPDKSMQAGWQPYIAVDDPDGIAAKAKELGGSALMDPDDMPQIGRVAILRDPQGAVFGIIKPEPAP